MTGPKTMSWGTPEARVEPSSPCDLCVAAGEPGATCVARSFS
jgi:hypothetical protein